MSESIKNDVVTEIQSVLDELNYRYEFDEENICFRIGFNLHSTVGSTKVWAFVEDTFFIAYATIDLKVTKNLYQVYEYLARANSGLLNGNFEIDSKEGDVRYKVFVEFGDKVPSRNTIRNAITMPVHMLEKYIDGLLSVITGAESPEDAVLNARSESNNES